MKKGVKIKQFDITDCGAACLASVCAYYGLQFPIARIRQYAFTDQKGTNILGLIEAANKLGLSAKGVRAKFEALYIVPKPVIAHVIVHEQLQHFVASLDAAGMILNRRALKGDAGHIEGFQKLLNAAAVFDLELPAHLLHGQFQAPHHVPVLAQQHPCVMVQGIIGHFGFLCSLFHRSTSLSPRIPVGCNLSSK